MPNVNPGWEERLATLKDPRSFSIAVEPNWGNLRPAGLTIEEYKRLCPKLELVREFALKMAYGMLKGTLKYPTDDYSIEQWLAGEDDDTVDAVDWRLLRMNAMKKEGMVSA